MDRGRVALLAVVLGYSASLSVINLASSLRVLDLTGAPQYLALTVTAYNTSYAAMSSTWAYVFVGRVSRVGMMSISLTAMALSAIGIGLAPSPAVVAALNASLGLFAAVATPVMTTIFTDYIGRDSRAVTELNTASSAGFIAGYVAGAVLRHLVPTSVTLIAMGSLMAVLAPVTTGFPPMFRVVEPRRSTYVSVLPLITGRLRAIPASLTDPRIAYAIRKLANDFARVVRVGVSRRFPLTITATATLFTAISTFFTPMPAYLRGAGFRDEELYVLSLTSTAVSTLSYRVVQRFVEPPELAWRVLIASVASRVPIFLALIPILTLPQARGLMYLLYVLIGVSWAGISTSLTLTVLGMSEPERRGERLGHLNAAISSGMVAGSVLSTFIASQGPLWTCTASSALVGVSAALYVKALRAFVT